MSAMLEFMVPNAESEAFNTAVYRFVELRRGMESDELVVLGSEPFGPVHRKKITLWDDAAIHDFVVYWSNCRKSPWQTSYSESNRRFMT